MLIDLDKRQDRRGHRWGLRGLKPPLKFWGEEKKRKKEKEKKRKKEREKKRKKRKNSLTPIIPLLLDIRLI